MRHILFFIIFTACAFAAQAQSIYRSTMPDGRVIYGDKPAPGAKESKQVDTTQQNISTPGPTSAPASDAKPQALDAANEEVRQAQNQLDAAKAALEGGREPGENERIGIAGGGTRLNEAYDNRIKSLEDAVAAAQKRLDAALARRNSARY